MKVDINAFGNGFRNGDVLPISSNYANKPLNIGFDPYKNKASLERDLVILRHKGPALAKSLNAAQLNRLEKEFLQHGFSVRDAKRGVAYALKQSRQNMNDPWLFQKNGRYAEFDFDSDGVPNALDCYPFDYDRQDFFGGLVSAASKAVSGAVSAAGSVASGVASTVGKAVGGAVSAVTGGSSSSSSSTTSKPSTTTSSPSTTSSSTTSKPATTSTSTTSKPATTSTTSSSSTTKSSTNYFGTGGSSYFNTGGTSVSTPSTPAPPATSSITLTPKPTTSTTSTTSSTNRGGGTYVNSSGQGMSSMVDPGAGYTKIDYNEALKGNIVDDVTKKPVTTTTNIFSGSGSSFNPSNPFGVTNPFDKFKTTTSTPTTPKQTTTSSNVLGVVNPFGTGTINTTTGTTKATSVATSGVSKETSNLILAGIAAKTVGDAYTTDLDKLTKARQIDNGIINYNDIDRARAQIYFAEQQGYSPTTQKAMDIKLKVENFRGQYGQNPVAVEAYLGAKRAGKTDNEAADAYSQADKSGVNPYEKLVNDATVTFTKETKAAEADYINKFGSGWDVTASRMPTKDSTAVGTKTLGGSIYTVYRQGNEFFLGPETTTPGAEGITADSTLAYVPEKTKTSTSFFGGLGSTNMNPFGTLLTDLDNKKKADDFVNRNALGTEVLTTQKAIAAEEAKFAESTQVKTYKKGVDDVQAAIDKWNSDVAATTANPNYTNRDVDRLEADRTAIKNEITRLADNEKNIINPMISDLSLTRNKIAADFATTSEMARLQAETDIANATKKYKDTTGMTLMEDYDKAIIDAQANMSGTDMLLLNVGNLGKTGAAALDIKTARDVRLNQPVLDTKQLLIDKDYTGYYTDQYGMPAKNTTLMDSLVGDFVLAGKQYTDPIYSPGRGFFTGASDIDTVTAAKKAEILDKNPQAKANYEALQQRQIKVDNNIKTLRDENQKYNQTLNQYSSSNYRMLSPSDKAKYDAANTGLKNNLSKITDLEGQKLDNFNKTFYDIYLRDISKATTTEELNRAYELRSLGDLETIKQYPMSAAEKGNNILFGTAISTGVGAGLGLAGGPAGVAAGGAVGFVGGLGGSLIQNFLQEDITRQTGSKSIGYAGGVAGGIVGDIGISTVVEAAGKSAVKLSSKLMGTYKKPSLDATIEYVKNPLDVGDIMDNGTLKEGFGGSTIRMSIKQGDDIYVQTFKVSAKTNTNIDDLGKAFVDASKKNGLINASTGQAVSLDDLFSIVKDEAGNVITPKTTTQMFRIATDSDIVIQPTTKLQKLTGQEAADYLAAPKLGIGAPATKTTTDMLAPDDVFKMADNASDLSAAKKTLTMKQFEDVAMDAKKVTDQKGWLTSINDWLSGTKRYNEFTDNLFVTETTGHASKQVGDFTDEIFATTTRKVDPDLMQLEDIGQQVTSLTYKKTAPEGSYMAISGSKIPGKSVVKESSDRIVNVSVDPTLAHSLTFSKAGKTKWPFGLNPDDAVIAKDFDNFTPPTPPAGTKFGLSLDDLANAETATFQTKQAAATMNPANLSAKELALQSKLSKMNPMDMGLYNPTASELKIMDSALKKQLAADLGKTADTVTSTANLTSKELALQSKLMNMTPAEKGLYTLTFEEQKLLNSGSRRLKKASGK